MFFRLGLHHIRAHRVRRQLSSSGGSTRRVQDWSILLAGVSACASVAAVAVSWRTATEQDRLARKLASEEHALLFAQIRTQRDNDVLQWCKECLAVLVDAERYVQEEKGDRNELVSRLSLLIDHGRIFFPNLDPEPFSQTKWRLDPVERRANRPAAYRGQREFALTLLVDAHDLLAAVGEVGNDVEWRGLTLTRERAVFYLQQTRRRFISEVQSKVDPRRFIRMEERFRGGGIGDGCNRTDDEK